MKTKFHHVSLKVKDFDKVVNFYKDVLGLKEKITWTMKDAPAAMLQMDDGGIVEVFGGNTDADEANARWGHLCIAVDDVPGTYKKAIEYGAKSSIEPGKTTIEGNEGKSVKLEYAFVQGFGGEILEFMKEG